MLHYNKYATGQFKRNFIAMDNLRLKALIKTDFIHCNCDTAQSRLSKAGIECLKWDIKSIEARTGLKRLILHQAITGTNQIFKC